MDRLAPLFARFGPTARVFYSGTLCSTVDFGESDGVGRLHLLRSGRLSVWGATPADALIIEQPSVLFFPRPHKHRLQSLETEGANLLCATVDFGNQVRSPLVDALPDVLVLPLQAVLGIEPTLDLLFTEAFNDGCGRQVALDRLIEYFLVLLLRYLIDSQTLKAGILNGLSDARLAKSIAAIHERPGYSWSLETLAKEAGMSRARFAIHFRQTVGTTPGGYLTEWRIGVAQDLLKRGKSIKEIARSVGYQSPAALRRVFARKHQMPPGVWLRK